VASLSSGDLLAFRQALWHEKSRKVDEALRDLLSKIRNDDQLSDQLAIACMRRLQGRGYDADICRCAKRAANRNPRDAEEIRQILSSFRKD
jgi:hypothetical protein